MDESKIDSKKSVPPAVDPDFKQVVEESKERLHQEEVKAPRKRGRPRKIDGSAPSALENKAPGSKEASNAPSHQSPAPDITKHLVTPLIAISRIPANHHGIPALALQEDEAKAAAESIQAILNAFVPDMESMSPKTAAVLGAFLVFGSIGFSKYQIYSEEMLKRQPKIPQPEPENNTGTPVFQNGAIRAEDVFRRNHV